MKWHDNDKNPTYSGRLTLLRENSHFEICRFSDNKIAFVDRKPRRDSKFWKKWEYCVWDLRENEKSFPAFARNNGVQ